MSYGGLSVRVLRRRLGRRDIQDFSRFLNSTGSRYAHTDLPTSNFQDCRRNSLRDPNVSAMESADERKAFSCAASFAASVAALYGLKSHALHYLRFMTASRDVLAEARIEIDIRQIATGKVSIVKWRGKPIFVYHRPPAVVQQERAVRLAELRDPQTDQERTQRPDWLIVVGICTHLGCVPIPNAGIIPGGFYCPCHGSHYDAAGRIRKGPAPTNMDIPEYKFISDEVILVG